MRGCNGRLERFSRGDHGCRFTAGAKSARRMLHVTCRNCLSSSESNTFVAVHVARQYRETFALAQGFTTVHRCERYVEILHAACAHVHPNDLREMILPIGFGRVILFVPRVIHINARLGHKYTVTTWLLNKQKAYK